MTKLYGIFHLPTGELVKLTNGRGANLITQRPRYLQDRLENTIDTAERQLKRTKEFLPDEHYTQEDIDNYISKAQNKLNKLNHCEVREIKYTMGAA